MSPMDETSGIRQHLRSQYDNDNDNTVKTTAPRKNYVFGDTIDLNPPKQNFRIHFENTNHIRPYNAWEKWKNGIYDIKARAYDCVLLNETGLAWDYHLRQQATKPVRRIHGNQAIFNTSNSVDTGNTTTQAGGTASLLVGRWTG